MKYVLITMLVLVIFIISVTLGAYNDQIVTFNYIMARRQLRVSTLLTVLFAAGFSIGWIISGFFWLRTCIALIQAKRKVKCLEQRIALLEIAATTTSHTEISASAPRN